jgi:hypothetical protein
MREAVTITPMLERAIQERGLQIPVIPLFVSREAVVLAGLESVDEEIVRSFFENREGLQVRDLFRSLELGKLPDRFVPCQETYLGQAWSVKLNPERTLLEELSDFLMASETRARIEATIRRRRLALVGYLDGVFGQAKRAVTLDLGFFWPDTKRTRFRTEAGGQACQIDSSDGLRKRQHRRASNQER